MNKTLDKVTSLFSIFSSNTLVLSLLLSSFLFTGTAYALPSQGDKVTLGEFVGLLIKQHPDSPWLPEHAAQMSTEEQFNEISQNLSDKGFQVLQGKSMDQSLEQMDFIRLVYAFSNQPAGKNLFEQKLYLKKAGIIETADVGMTTGLFGKVYQKHQEQQEQQEAKLSAAVYMNDRFKSHLSSRANLIFDDKSTLVIGEDSVIKVTKHIYNPDNDLRQTVVHLSEGIVRFVVTKGKAEGSEFKVVTPTATAGVRGTEFVVIVDSDGKTTFLVLEGQIETRSLLPNGEEGDIFLVSAGESQTVFENGIVSKVVMAPLNLLVSTIFKTLKPLNTITKKVLSRQAVSRTLGKLAAVKNLNIKMALNSRLLKSKILNLANVTALLNVNALDEKLSLKEKLSPLNLRDSKLVNSAGLVLKDSLKADVKDNAKALAKLNAKINAKVNAKINVTTAVKQVVQEVLTLDILGGLL